MDTTRAVEINLGERRKPHSGACAGFLCVDSVHKSHPALLVMEARSSRPVVPGWRQAVKQGRRALARQRPCCKPHPSAVKPVWEPWDSAYQRGVGSRGGRSTMAVALASRFWRLRCPKIFNEVATRLAPLMRSSTSTWSMRSPGALSHIG